MTKIAEAFDSASRAIEAFSGAIMHATNVLDELGEVPPLRDRRYPRKLKKVICKRLDYIAWRHGPASVRRRRPRPPSFVGRRERARLDHWMHRSSFLDVNVIRYRRR